MANLDPRLLRLGIEINGSLRFYEDLAITASGAKFANPNQAECTITVTNLRREVRDFILTEGSPFNRNRTPKTVTVEAGRASTGYSLLYVGNIFRSSVSQPPDQVVTIRALAGQFQKANIVSNSLPGVVPLSQIAQRVAGDLGYRLDFQATDRTLSDYSFTGSAPQQVIKLDQMNGINAFIDSNTLFVKNDRTPLNGRLRVLSPRTGLIGIPDITEQGIKVTMLYDNQTVIGGAIELESDLYPLLNGRYVIYKLLFQVANRDTPFYLTAEARRMNT